MYVNKLNTGFILKRDSGRLIIVWNSKKRMKIQSYKKHSIDKLKISTFVNKTKEVFQSCSLPARRRLFYGIVLFLGVIFVSVAISTQDFEGLKNDDIVITFDIPSAAVAPAKTSVISIPAGTVKANPFLPYKEISFGGNSADVPQSSLVAPPTTLGEDPDAIRIMDTIVSGILYDAFSPSAILNIEGNDYLVKKGDVVNNYNIVAITRDTVTVKLGANVYKAGIGQILTEGNMNHNEVSNLKNKFGGDR